MRALSALVLLFLGVLVVFAYQAIKQELVIRELKDHIDMATTQVRRDEDGIIQAKLKIQEVNTLLTPVNQKKAELTKKKQDGSAAAALVLKSLQDCQSQKTEAETKMNADFETLQNLKAQQGSEKVEADDEIKGLKQQILDRDSKICEFVDMTNAEGRKLCGVAEAPK
ncbi:hypothetical protein AGOR_G00209170 [Albula goreensis]|uniref:Uncharacterized protein n=1 Tax=Albula goreensis TaxID=1534307 RepID=A0A8T3CRT3_9TELE|nr:hypothetical protein AGOR_G00209170 [Albula goreensis]